MNNTTDVAKTEKTKNWNQFSKKNGKFMLGLIVAFASFGFYMSKPDVTFAADYKGQGKRMNVI